MNLSAEERVRYSRHLSLSSLGEEGQICLKNATILVVGAGGLGCSALLYLVAAGVGKITVIDADTVALSNLHRQILYNSEDIGRSKVETARGYLIKLNPHSQINCVNAELNYQNVDELVQSHALVVDATDNFKSRYLINDSCRKHAKPLSYAAVFQFEGHSCFFSMGPEDPCLRCLFPIIAKSETIQNCGEAGVLGVVPGLFGLMQAKDCLLFLINKNHKEDLPFINALFQWDLMSSQPKSFKIQRSKTCPVCAGELVAPVQAEVPALEEISVNDFFENWMQSQFEKPQQERWILLDVRDFDEVNIDKIIGSIHVPLATVEVDFRYQDINTPIVVYCKTGARSAVACRILNALGYLRTLSLKGGILDWQYFTEGR